MLVRAHSANVPICGRPEGPCRSKDHDVLAPPLQPRDILRASSNGQAEEFSASTRALLRRVILCRGPCASLRREILRAEVLRTDAAGVKSDDRRQKMRRPRLSSSSSKTG